jgi:hypothetical protein
VNANRVFKLQGGTLSGGGKVDGSLTNSGGVVVIGDNANAMTLTVTGDYVQGANGILQVSVSATADGQLAVTGSATLAGGVEVLVQPGYVPQSGDSALIVTAATGFGAFDGASDFWALTYFDQPDQVVLYYNG